MRRILHLYRDAYVGQPAAVWWLCFVLLVNRAGSMVMPFLMLYLTLRRGVAVETAGVMVGLFGAGSLIGTWVGGWLADRVNPVQVQVVSLLGNGALLALLPWIDDLGAFAAALVLTAAFGDALRPANSVMLLELAPADRRTQVFALSRLAVNLGWGVGTAIGGFLAAVDYHLLFWVDGATSIAAGMLLLRLVGRGRSRPQTGTDASLRAPWRDGPFLALLGLSLLLSCSFMQCFGAFTVHLREHYAMGERAIGVLLSLNAALIVAFEMALVHALRGVPKLPVCAVGALLTGVGLGITPLGHTFAFAAFGLTLWTFGEMLAFPLLMAVVGERADPRQRGAYMGLYSSVFGVAFLLAPVLGTAAYGRGPWVLWTACGVAGASVAGGLLALHRYDRQNGGLSGSDR